MSQKRCANPDCEAELPISALSEGPFYCSVQCAYEKDELEEKKKSKANLWNWVEKKEK